MSSRQLDDHDFDLYSTNGDFCVQDSCRIRCLNFLLLNPLLTTVQEAFKEVGRYAEQTLNHFASKAGVDDIPNFFYGGPNPFL